MTDIDNIQSERDIPREYAEQWRQSLNDAYPLILQESRDVPLHQQEEHGWKLIKEVEGVRILKKKIDGKLVAKGMCEIDTRMTPEQFLHFVDKSHADAATAEEIASNVIASRVVTKLDEGHCVMHLQVETPGGMLVSNRDFVFIVGTKMEQMNRVDPSKLAPAAVRFGRSVEHPELLKPAKGFARGEMFLNGWYVEQVSEDKLVAQYFMSNKIGGWIPSALIEKQLLDGPLTLVKYKELVIKSTVTIKTDSDKTILIQTQTHCQEQVNVSA